MPPARCSRGPARSAVRAAHGQAHRDLRSVPRPRVRDLGARITDSFLDVAATGQVQATESPLPAKLVDLVAKRADRCMRLVEAGQ